MCVCVCARARVCVCVCVCVCVLLAAHRCWLAADCSSFARVLCNYALRVGQATGIAQMLADQAMLIPGNDIARDGVSDSPNCLFYISGVALDGAVGLAG
jgi:hypothetical protein